MSEDIIRAQGGGVSGLRSIGTITNDIRVHAQMAMTSFILIGQDLIDAKAQLKQGEWLPWLNALGISVRSAENYMRLTREIAPGSKLASLGYTKALAMLALPAEEREAFAEENKADEKSAAEIKRLIAEKQMLEANNATLQDKYNAETALRIQAQEDREKSEQKLTNAEKEYRKWLATAQEKVKAEQDARQRWQHECEQLRDAPPKTITVEKTVEVMPPDYEKLKKRKTEAENAAAEQEERAVMAEQRVRELEEQAAKAPETETAGLLSFTEFAQICAEFTARAWMVPNMNEAFQQMNADELRSWRIAIGGIQAWAERAAQAVDAAGMAVPAEGCVYSE